MVWTSTWRRRRRDYYIQRVASISILASAALLFGVEPASALWGEKRFKYEGLIDAGQLGLEKMGGRIAAFGDYDGDQFTDVFVLGSDLHTVTVHKWDHSAFTFTEPVATLSMPSTFHVTDVVLSDFNYDGRLDALLMGQSQPPSDKERNTEEVKMQLWLGQPEGGFFQSSAPIPSSTFAHPLVFDGQGDMRMDLLAHPFDIAASVPRTLKMWRNAIGRGEQETAFDVVSAPFLTDSNSPDDSGCQLATPHMSGFVDLNGDCLADLFLVCADPSDHKSLSYRIYTNTKPSQPAGDSASSSGGFTLSRTGTFPPGSGAVTFADMNRDGTVDLVFPSCDPDKNGGIFGGGSKGECYINIAYNRQAPLCNQRAGQPFGGTDAAGGGEGRDEQGRLTCRDPENMCQADDGFKFNMSVDPSNPDLVRIPISSILPGHSLVLSDTVSSPNAPVPLRPGDFNLDGYPDLLVLTVPPHAQIDETRVYLLRSVACDGKGAACGDDPKVWERRGTFEVVTGPQVDALGKFKDVRSASWFDVDEDGTLDIVLQRLPSSDWDDRARTRQVTFIKNNFFHDAFFLKAMVLNGACLGKCEPKDKPKYKPLGVNYAGASYKFTILDTVGKRRATQVGQLPQLSYLTLGTPYSYFGLGRTNNYVENLFVGTTRRRQSKHYVNMEGVIPNSQVVIVPWQGEPGKEVDDPSGWHKELYLQPGEWIPWVTVTLVTAIVMLAGVTFLLHLNEKREDERERKRAVHAINFDAL